MEASQVSNYPAENTSIPLQMYKGHAFVAVQIGNSTHLFALDSGAPTIISKKLADQLNLKAEGEITLSDVGGSQLGTRFYQIPQLEMGDITFKNVGALAVDISQTNEADYAKCLEVSGIIGSTVLNLCNWKISLKNKELVCLPKSFTFKGKHAVGLSYKELGYPTLLVEINDTAIPFTFDLGSNGCLTLPSSLSASFSKTAKDSILSRGFLHTAFGKTEDTVYKSLLLNNIKVGNLTVKEAYCDLLPSLKNHGLLGTQFMKNFDVYLLYLNDVAGFVPVDTESENMSYGFEWFLDPYMTTRINMVFNNSILDKAGVTPGDRINYWNDIDTRGRIDFQKYCALLKSDTLAEDSPKEIRVELANGEVKSFYLKPYNVFANPQ